MTHLIREVASNDDISLRNRLLQETLRDPLPPFPIEDEYPIILSPNMRRGARSFVLTKDSQIISHTNLWTRTILNPNEKKDMAIGLIGNVATDPGFQGQGYMRTLLDWTLEKARSLDLDAIILWSDLGKFYHKLGFESLGSEIRYFFEPATRSKARNSLQFLQGKDITKDRLLKLLRLRPPCTTVERSVKEFATLTSIPNTTILVNDIDNIEAYMIIGKGADLMGVIHEWGGEIEHIVSGILLLLEQLPMTILLSPERVPNTYRDTFESLAVKIERHPMALGKILKPRASNDLEDLFIWGLDSI